MDVGMTSEGLGTKNCLIPHTQHLTPDLIVIGSGIAGLYAALLASRHGRVLLVTKAELEESNTRYAQGGIAVAMAPGDSPELHVRDTIAAGDGLCDREAVSILAQDAPGCIGDLLACGVPFDREGGELAWTREAAHSVPRILHAGGDATGAGIERALAAAARESGVQIVERTVCTSLIVERGRVVGAALLRTDGTRLEARAPAVILATGGAGRMYARTTNPEVATGDGQVLAFRAGAALADLEFMQFHPTALAIDGAPSFLVSEAVRGEGGILRDRFGTRFMAGYHPDRELAPRDVVARAIHRQMSLTDSNHVYLDVRHLNPERIERRFPNIVSFCRKHGIDPTRDLLPVSPAAHYWMGGVWTDADARTTVPGLYACGEVACTGVHGANRLASNSLLEGLVFARRAVGSIVQDDVDWPAPEGELLTAPTWDGQQAGSEAGTLAQVMWDDAGLVRSSESLARAAEYVGPTDDLAFLASLLVHAASLRTESRGAHFRSDFPQSDPAWLGRILLWCDGARFVPLPGESREELCA